MQSIKNLTRKPLSVPLPRGKRLFLGPGKTGQIDSKSTAHPPLVALVEAGELELLGEGASFAGRGGTPGTAAPSGSAHIPGKSVFKSGDG